MTWANNLLECSFRGFVIDVQKTDDSAEYATAEHSYPYRHGADVEDLGRDPWHIPLEVIFFGDDYEARLQKFLELLDEPGFGELIHPVFGSIKAKPKRVAVHHEADNVDQAHITVEFIESTPSSPFFDRTLAAQQANAVGTKGDIARSKLATALSDLIGTLRANNPLSLFTELRQSMTLPILATMSQVQGVLMSGQDVISAPRAFCNDISGMVDGMLNLSDFGSNVLYGFGAFGRLASLFDIFGSGKSASITTEPVFAAGVPTEAQAIAAVQAHISSQTAIGQATAAGMVLASESETATLTPAEIETVANTARSALEDAINATRNALPIETARPIVESLKDQALTLLNAAQAIIETRPPLIDIPAPISGNWRLQAHALYSDHTRAPELFRLNASLRDPNFISQGDIIHAFAS